MFDAATLREEMAALEKLIPLEKNKTLLINRYVNYARQLRELEYKELGYVTARNSVTGY